MVRKKRDGGNRVVIVHMPVLSRPFLINIAFSLEFYSSSFSIRCFPAPETYCIRGKHSRKYGICIPNIWKKEKSNISEIFSTATSCCTIGEDGWIDGYCKDRILMKHSASLELQIEQQLGQTTSYALIHPSPQRVGSGGPN